MKILDLDALTQRALVQKVLRRRRRHRARFLLSKVETYPTMRVLDVGCGRDGNSLEAELPETCSIVGIDLLDPSDVRIRHPGFSYVQQDAEDLSRFRDRAFDLAISVGMMEHICERPKLERMAAEMLRVARQVVIVVPWRYAWIEPHFKIPLFQLLPRAVKTMLLRMFGSRNYRGLAKDPEALHRYLDGMFQWLPTSEWKRIFRASRAYLGPTLETLVVVASQD